MSTCAGTACLCGTWRASMGRSGAPSCGGARGTWAPLGRRPRRLRPRPACPCRRAVGTASAWNKHTGFEHPYKHINRVINTRIGEIFIDPSGSTLCGHYLNAFLMPAYARHNSDLCKATPDLFFNPSIGMKAALLAALGSAAPGACSR